VRIAYAAAATIPSSRANSIQVMKVCQALKQNGDEVRLYVPGRTASSWQSMQQLYGLQTEFPIEWIPVWNPSSILTSLPGSSVRGESGVPIWCTPHATGGALVCPVWHAGHSGAA